MFLFKNDSALRLLVIHGHHPTVFRQRSKRWLLLSAVLLEKVSFLALNLRTLALSKTFSKSFLFYLKADFLQIISSFFGASFHTLKAPCRDQRNKSDPKHSAPLLKRSFACTNSSLLTKLGKIKIISEITGHQLSVYAWSD